MLINVVVILNIKLDGGLRFNEILKISQLNNFREVGSHIHTLTTYMLLNVSR